MATSVFTSYPSRAILRRLSLHCDVEIIEHTLDDVLRHALDAIQAKGRHIEPNKGGATELVGVLIELTNPRARLSRTETRGKLFSGLGELCWYLSGSNQLDFIQHYIPEYVKSADGAVIYGGYGPRLFEWHSQDQLRNVTELLRRHSVSRQAVIQLFDAVDLAEKHADIPCTSTLQLLIRDNKLHWITCMRSNDWFLGMPHDFFAFTMLQEIVARTVGVEVGIYKHFVGSLHLYDRNADAASRFRSEGWQSTQLNMPNMPVGDPADSIATLLQVEQAIRTDGTLDGNLVNRVDPYWGDLMRLLAIFNACKEKNIESAQAYRKQMVSPIYDVFIRKMIEETR